MFVSYLKNKVSMPPLTRWVAGSRHRNLRTDDAIDETDEEEDDDGGDDLLLLAEEHMMMTDDDDGWLYWWYSRLNIRHNQKWIPPVN